MGDRGTVVKVLCYKSEGGWFDSRWCQSCLSVSVRMEQLGSHWVDFHEI